MKTTKKVHLENIIAELENFPSQFIGSSERIMKAGNSKLFTMDLLALAVNNRAISLTNGFVTLVKSENYLTSVTLIRIQLDNALRFFASTLVKSSSDFAMYFLDGKPIKNYEDINGKKLSDSYLAKKLEVYFKGVKKLYDDTCGYIHLSDRHFFPTVSKGNKEGLKFGIKIGSSENFTIEDKIDFSQTMLEVSKLVLIVIEEWKREKMKLSEIYDKQKAI